MITLYGLGTCDTCKKARAWLQNFAVTHAFIDYRNHRPSSQMLMEWANRRGGFPALVNKSSTTWRQLPEHRKTPASDAEWLALLGEYPQLIKRPLITIDDGCIHQGFSEAALDTLLGVNA